MKRLLFVYTEHSGLGNGEVNFFYRVLNPQKNACGLLTIRFDSVQRKKAWICFLLSLPKECRFLHRDEFVRQHNRVPVDGFPAVFSLDTTGLIQLLTRREMEAAQTLEQLIHLVGSKLHRQV